MDLSKVLNLIADPNATAEQIFEAVVQTGQDIWAQVWAELQPNNDRLCAVYALASRDGHVEGNHPPM